MTSESPLLLVDSALPDVVGNNPRTTYLVLDAHRSIPFQLIESTGIYAAPPRFRARIKHNGVWDAAIRDWMTGVYNSGTGQWVSDPSGEYLAPTQYEVFLNDGALKYTFVVIREDVPFHWWDRNWSNTGTNSEEISSYHERPFLSEQFPQGDGNRDDWDPFVMCMNPGLGLPYLGLCVEIEDNYGHKVEIDYCDTESRSADLTQGDGCVECTQGCAAKGTINSVRLKVNEVTRWTLLYSYRGIRGGGAFFASPLREGDSDNPYPPADGSANNWYYEALWGSYQLDSIYVYEGDVPGIDDLCLRVDHRDRMLDDSGNASIEGGTDPLESYVDGNPGFQYLLDWKHRVREHYAYRTENNTSDPSHASILNTALKVMTSVQTVQDTSIQDSPVLTKRWVYLHQGLSSSGRYKNPDGPDAAIGSFNNFQSLLRDIFEPEDVDRALLEARQRRIGSSGGGANSGFSITQLVRLTDALGGELDREDAEILKDYASIQFGYPADILGQTREDWPDAASTVAAGSQHSDWEMPDAGGLVALRNGPGEHGQYILNEKDRLQSDVWNRNPWELSIRDETGARRHYRLHRLRVLPVASTPKHGAAFHTNSNDFEGDNPHTDSHKSIYFHPYQWRGWSDTESFPGSSTGPDLTDPRWVIVVDEFSSRESMIARVDNTATPLVEGPYSGDAQVKPGQMSRRVVEMSPSGYVLRDRRWEYGESGILRFGGGLGEQYVYQTIEDHLPPGSIEAWVPPADPDLGEGVLQDPFASFRNELLLVEYRSVGWSAGSDTERISNGFTRFNEYKLFNPGGATTLTRSDYDEPEEEEAMPLSSRVQQVSRGIRRGTSFGDNSSSSVHPKQYTHQILRNPDNPGQIVAEIEFQELAFEGDLLSDASQLPNWSAGQVPPPPPTAYKVKRVFEHRDDSDPELEEYQQPLLSKLVVGTPRQLYPGSPWFYPVDREFYEDGSPVWSATGQLVNPIDPGASASSHQALTFTFYDRDDEGRSQYTIADAGAGSLTDPQTGTTLVIGSQPQWPEWPVDENGTTWARIGSAPALNYVTAFRYDTYGPGLCDIWFPNGRRWARRVVEMEEFWTDVSGTSFQHEYSAELILNDIVEITSNHYEVRSLSEYREYTSIEPFGTPVVQQSITLPDPLTTLDIRRQIDLESIPFEVQTEARIGVDQNGRLSEVTMLERSPSGALLNIGSKEINDLGELYREQSIDGTVVLQVRNSLGQTVRTYRGTQDERWYVTDPHNYPESDMILLERTEYGQGINDAWLPTIVRSYDRDSPAITSNPFDPVDESLDTNSVASTVGYDWQSRAVRSDSYERGALSSNPRRLATTLNYLDFLGRTYLTVSYGEDTVGATLSVTNDPVAHTESTPRVAASEVFGFGVKPLSVVENYYGIDGSLVERRSYDTDWIDDPGDPNDAPGYHAEFMYFGRGGQQVYAVGPSSPLTYTQIDPLGRISSVITAKPLPLAGANADPFNAYQLARTDFEYDADGNVIETARWVRVDNGHGDVLTGSNAVRTRTLNWYNEQKRLMATAELGTEDSMDRYVFNGAGLYTPTQASYEWPFWDGSQVQRLGVPADALLSVYEYDEAGNKILDVDPRGVVTEYEYSGSNRLVFKTENAMDPDPDLRRQTGYRYQYGRLVEMNIVTADNRAVQIGGSTPPPTPPSDPDLIGNEHFFGNITVTHQSRVDYGAEIVWKKPDGYGWFTYEVISLNPGLVASLNLPDPQTGEPSAENDVFLRYTYSGQVAERYDNNGNAFRYDYDELGRVTSVEVGHWDPADGYPHEGTYFVPGTHVAIGGISTGAPPDRIGFVEYVYDERSNATDVIAYDERGGLVLTHTHLDYERDRLATEWQELGASPSTDTPRIDYSWSYVPTDVTSTAIGDAQPGHHRLSSIEYPVPDPTIDRRLLTLEYGVAGSHEDLMSWVTGLSSSFGTQQVAEFGYIGDGRRFMTNLGGSEIQSDDSLGSNNNDANPPPDPVIGIPKWDRFGRRADLLYRDSHGGTLYRADSTFDEVGNRTSKRITQVDVAGASRDNVRSVIHTYDGLNRLARSQFGTLDSGSVPALLGDATRDDQFTMDLLGNWSGAVDPSTGLLTAAGKSSYGNLDGYGTPWALSTADAEPDGFEITYAVNGRDAIDEKSLLQQEYDSGGTLLSETPSTVTPVYDNGGNLVFDGTYAYQYDAWGRLVQINEATEVTPGDYDVGAFVKHFLYDGFGRMVRATSAYPEPGPTSTETRVTRYFYDGARCIQEVLVDPTPSKAAAQLSGDPNLQTAAAGTSPLGSDGSSTPVQMENNLIGGPIPISRNIHREYVWGPGDNGFDEILLQSDHEDEEWWTMQDTGGDVVAVAILRPSDNKALIKQQYTYDAYGTVLSAEDIGPKVFQSHIGHNGLFVDRLDAPIGDNTTQPPRLIPFAHALYQNRNRTYHPGMGRFLQMDPNMTAVAMMSVAAMHGGGFGSLSIAFDMEGLFGDGMNLYQYLASNPVNRSDPLGLNSFFDDEIDNLINEIVGNRAAILSALGKEAQAAAVVAARIASYLPFPGVGIVGELALVALGEQSGGEAMAAIALGIIPGGKLIGKAGAKIFKAIGSIGGAAWKQAKALASQGGSFLRKAGSGLVERAKSFLNRKPRAVACGCFTASTLVWTASGAVPIGDIEAGQQVLAAPEAGESWDLAGTEVGAKIVIGEASLVRLTLRHADGSLETIDTTDEHPFHVATTNAWTRADGLLVGDSLSTITGTAELLAVEYGDRRVPVYNLSIPGRPTYYIGEHGVWVHNCGAGAHHLIPKYLGGLAKGITTRLDSAQHSRLHVLINEAGAKRGIPKHSGPGNGKRGVERWVADVGNEHAEQAIRESLIEAYTSFDKQFGTNLFAEMYGALLGGPVRR